MTQLNYHYDDDHAATDVYPVPDHILSENATASGSKSGSKLEALARSLCGYCR